MFCGHYVSSVNENENEKTMMSKLRIKAGDLEIECEGTEEFLKNELMQLVQDVLFEFHAVAVHSCENDEEGPVEVPVLLPMTQDKNKDRRN